MESVQSFWGQISSTLGAYLPSLAGAVAILILGWLVALAISALTRKLLSKTDLDNKAAAWITGEERLKGFDVEQGISKGVFYLIMLFVLVAFFQALGITQITEPLNRFLTQVFEFAPQIFGAALLLIIAWAIASVLRTLVSRGLSALGIDRKLGSEAGLVEITRIPLTKSLSETVYWLVFLLFLPAVLSTLGLEGILRPIQTMVDKILGFLPNIFTAAVILAVGWFVARIVQRIVTNLLAAVGTDKLLEKVGLTEALGKQGLSGLIGLILYVFILIPIIIAALNALAIEAITRPASEMLNTILGAIPDIFAATLVVTIAYVVGRLVTTMITNLLAGVGFNSLFVWLGVSQKPAEGTKTPSAVIGYLILVIIMLFAVIEATDLLGFTALSNLISQMIIFVSHIIVGLIVFGIGLFLANLVSQTIKTTKMANASVLAMVSRIAILVLVGAMALRQMGLANEIINLAFGLILGAIALALAIALGVGGRDIAARELDQWMTTIKSDNTKSKAKEKPKIDKKP
jgi:hypothetical protein